MDFIDRLEEMRRLESLWRRREGGLVVVYGRRRVGKTRLLLEWCHKHGGLYVVADSSAASVQRKYFAEVVDTVFPGFKEVEYPDWRVLLSRLAQASEQAAWRGPLVIDELPYLVASAPELPSVLQHWMDHEAKKASLIVALAGSSMRMMHGLALDAASPLYGRAVEVFPLLPMRAAYLQEALSLRSPRQVIEAFTVWGGTPRYWELAEGVGGDLEAAVDQLVLDPLGPLHREPDRLLAEEGSGAMGLRPLLDAIGMGANRVSEIGARVGQPVTSLTRMLSRVVDLGLVRREVPFGESEKSSKRTLYRIADPFFSFWFQVVASRRSLLAAAAQSERRRVWKQAKPALLSSSWEELARQSVSRFSGADCPLASSGPWAPAGRYWQGSGPEWDIVATSTDGKRLLVAEAKWTQARTTAADVAEATAQLLRKGSPPIRGAEDKEVLHAVFVPEAPKAYKVGRGSPILVTAEQVVEASR